MLALVLSSAFLVGLAAGVCRPLDATGAALAAVAAGLGAVLARSRPGPRWLGLVAAAAALGVWRASTGQGPSDSALAPFVASRVVVEGEIAATPARVGATTRVVLIARTVSLANRSDSQAVEARVQVVDRADGVASRLGIGDRVRAEGRLMASSTSSSTRHETPELLFPHLTLVERAAGLDPRTVAAGLRADAVRAIQRLLAEPEASLAAGLLLGGSGNLDPEFRQQLQRSGLSHLLAVDGYKQVVVSGALQVVALRLLGRRLAAPGIILGVTAYTVLTGASPSAVRAGIMVGLAVMAGVVGRIHDPLTGVLLAGAVMSAVQPPILLELAFQLSFTATLGLILLYPRVRTMFHGLPRWIGEPAGVTLAVTIATLPVTLAVFQQVSIVSPLAHVLATPLVPLVLLGASVLVVSTWFPPLASIAATACWLPTTVLAEVVRFSGNLPGAALDTGRLPTVAACGLLAALLAWGVWELPDVAGCRAAVRTYAARSSWLVELRLPLALAAVGLVSIVSLLLVRPDGRLHLSNLALRRGEAVLIRTPAGSTALVVHGPVDARELAERVRESLPVWEHTLALAVVLDPADERGLEDTLRQYPAGHVWDASADARLDLGRGAVVDLFAYPRPAVGVGYGETWIPVAGRSE